MKVFCIGDCSVNVFLQIPNETENVSLNQENRFMQFKLGSKTQLENEIVTVGGNALNVAVGLNRQGIDIDFYSIIGKDIDGNRITEFLDKEKRQFSNRTIEQLDNVKTNVGYVVSFQTERFLLIDTSEKNYKLSSFAKATEGQANYELSKDDFVFLSSVGPKYEEFFRDVLELKSKIGFKLAYNPSSNELKNDVDTFIEMVKTSDLLFVNKKEAGKILSNTNQSDKTEELIKKLWEFNKKITVVTDGKRGSWVYDGEKIYYEAASGEKAVEKTGAGDAYESGFLAEFLKTGDIQAAMKNGTENAGSVIKFIGATEGLLYD